mmetsp:Transcript_40947/g.103773  ORF Transcript_40947/g.103773 Transcript_40947/m.103773 type:complete len:291 (-) Transcript_40947:46-918(-)
MECAEARPAGSASVATITCTASAKQSPYRSREPRDMRAADAWVRILKLAQSRTSMMRTSSRPGKRATTVGCANMAWLQRTLFAEKHAFHCTFTFPVVRLESRHCSSGSIHFSSSDGASAWSIPVSATRQPSMRTPFERTLSLSRAACMAASKSSLNRVLNKQSSCALASGAWLHTAEMLHRLPKPQEAGMRTESAESQSPAFNASTTFPMVVSLVMSCVKPAKLPRQRHAAARTDASLSVLNPVTDACSTARCCASGKAPNTSAVSLSDTRCAAARTIAELWRQPTGRYS